MQLKYSIKEKKEDPLESILLVEGLTNETTLGDVIEHLEYTKSSLDQATKQKEVNTAQNLVAEAAMPFLKDVAPERYDIVALYIKHKQEEDSLDERIKACEDTIESYEKYVTDIKQQTSILDPKDLV